jgi:hypothetical protein
MLCRLILQQESEAARGGVQLLVSVAVRQNNDRVRVRALNPISLTAFSLELQDDFRQLAPPYLPRDFLFTDVTRPAEEAALTKFCSRLRLVNTGQVSERERWINGWHTVVTSL